MSSSIPERVQGVLSESGYDDDELAELMPISKTTAWRWRTGRVTEFTNNNLKIIANTFQVNYEWLKRGAGPKKKNENTVPYKDLKKAYEDRKARQSPSRKERDLLIEHLQERAESLARDLRRLADLDKNRSDE